MCNKQKSANHQDGQRKRQRFVCGKSCNAELDLEGSEGAKGVLLRSFDKQGTKSTQLGSPDQVTWLTRPDARHKRNTELVKDAERSA